MLTKPKWLARTLLYFVKYFFNRKFFQSCRYIIKLTHGYATGKQYLETLALNSGGREFEATSLSNLDTAFSGIAEELRRQYSIGYYPEKVGQLGERRSISIRVNRPNVVVRAKNSYIVGQTNRNLAGK